MAVQLIQVDSDPNSLNLLKEERTTLNTYLPCLSKHSCSSCPKPQPSLCELFFPELGQTNHAGRCSSGQFGLSCATQRIILSPKTELSSVNFVTETVDKVVVQVWAGLKLRTFLQTKNKIIFGNFLTCSKTSYRMTLIMILPS